MGAEEKCFAEFHGVAARGTVRLEREVLQFFASDLRVSIPLRDVTRTAERDGILRITFRDGRAEFMFDIGEEAKKWAQTISRPPTLIDTLGVRRKWWVSAIGEMDRAFLQELGRAVMYLSIGRVVRHSDAIFIAPTRAAQLSRLPRLKKFLKPEGVIWVIRPKGHTEISEQAVRDAGRAAGLVDLQIVGFSPTHTAVPFVILPARLSRSPR